MEREKALDAELALLRKSFSDQLQELSQVRQQKEADEAAHIAQLREREQMWNTKLEAAQRALKVEADARQSAERRVEELTRSNVR